MRCLEGSTVELKYLDPTHIYSQIMYLIISLSLNPMELELSERYAKGIWETAYDLQEEIRSLKQGDKLTSEY